jgi:hypothetical protein
MTPQERMVFFLRDGLTNEEKDYFPALVPICQSTWMWATKPELNSL